MMEGEHRPEEELQFITVPEGSLPSALPPQYNPVQGGQAPPPGGGDPNDAFAFIKQTRHPVAALFHFLFKGLALLFYMFGGWFSSNFVFICVMCILLLAFDFWTVKNVTGRLLVGLRWWNNVRDDGTNEWVFESIENPGEVHPTDARLFWTGLYVTPCLWIFFLIIAVLKFSIQWLVIVFVAIVLSCANIVGYYKCSNDQKNKLKSVMEDTAFKTAIGMGSSAVQSFITSAFNGGVARQQQGAGAAQQHV